MTDRVGLREKIASELFMRHWLRQGCDLRTAAGLWANSPDPHERDDAYEDADRVLALIEPLVGARVPEYDVELSWGWAGFKEVERWHIREVGEIDALVRGFIPRMVDRYAFDCGRVSHPLNVWLYGLRIQETGKSEYRPTTEYDALVEAAVEAKRAALAQERG